MWTRRRIDGACPPHSTAPITPLTAELSAPQARNNGPGKCITQQLLGSRNGHFQPQELWEKQGAAGRSRRWGFLTLSLWIEIPLLLLALGELQPVQLCCRKCIPGRECSGGNPTTSQETPQAAQPAPGAGTSGVLETSDISPSVLRTLCTQERDPSSLDSLVEAGGHESPGERGTSRSDLGDERAAGWETASLQGELLTADGTSSPGGTEGLDLQQEQLFRQVFTQQQAGGQIWAVGEDGQGHRTKIS